MSKPQIKIRGSIIHKNTDSPAARSLDAVGFSGGNDEARASTAPAPHFIAAAQ